MTWRESTEKRLHDMGYTWVGPAAMREMQSAQADIDAAKAMLRAWWSDAFDFEPPGVPAMLRELLHQYELRGDIIRRLAKEGTPP